jgi:hypothetical protein
VRHGAGDGAHEADEAHARFTRSTRRLRKSFLTSSW